MLQILHNSWCRISIIQLLESITRGLMSAEVRDGTGALFIPAGCVDCTLVFVTRSVTSSARSSGHSRYRDHVTNPRLPDCWPCSTIIIWITKGRKRWWLRSFYWSTLQWVLNLNCCNYQVLSKGCLCVVVSEVSPGCRERLCRPALVVGAQSGRDRVRSETPSDE